MTKTLQALPEFLTLQAGGRIDIEASSDDKKTPKFTMLAYTGGLMEISGFDLPVIVDLEGMELDRQDIPVRMDNDNTKGIGHTNSVTIAGGKLAATGVISRSTQFAHDVTESGKKGFPWQASIGAKPKKTGQNRDCKRSGC